MRRERRMVVDDVSAYRVENGAVEIYLNDTKGRRLTLYIRRKATQRHLLDQLAKCVRMP
jgi:hypothetical protein